MEADPTSAKQRAKVANRTDERFPESDVGIRERYASELEHVAACQVKRWPSFSFLVLRYSSACGLGVTSQGTRSTTFTPAVSRAFTLSGLLESRRTRVTPSALRISAGRLKSR